MSEDIRFDATDARLGAGETAQRTVLAGGGVLGALAMTSCCILPLVLFSLGVTGAWIGNLAALYPYKLYFFVPAVGFLAGGFYKAYRKPAASECGPEGACAVPPMFDRINRIVLWAASVLVLAALAFPYVVPAFLDS
ncbi:MAG: mercuric transporter MerT family protein [Kiloniellales bacterium]